MELYRTKKDLADISQLHLMDENKVKKVMAKRDRSFFFAGKGNIKLTVYVGG